MAAGRVITELLAPGGVAPQARNQGRDTAFRTLHCSDRCSLTAGIFGLIAFIKVSRNPRFALIHNR
jgi:hypothetical protein